MTTTLTETLQVACPHCAVLNRLPAGKPAGKGKCGKCGGALFEGKPVALRGATADRFLRDSDLPVLIDFWAAWCGPCRMMAPVFERAAAELEPAVRLAKVDTEAEQQLAARFGIRSIPTLVLVEKGQEIARISGAMQLPALLNWVRNHVEA